MNTKRVALYARASTLKQAHSIENQLSELRQYAKQRGWEIYREYTDEGVSGGKDRRPGLDLLMADARRRRFDVVAVLKFDRFARSSRHLVVALEEFRDLGVEFVSLGDAIDTGTAIGRVVYTILAAISEFERDVIRERVALGVRKAIERGKRVGRRPAEFDLAKARLLASEGLSYSAIGKELGISRMTVARALAAQKPSRKLAPALVSAGT
jgi:DNA invertase Pin-like site-specific DNA recombinase